MNPDTNDYYGYSNVRAKIHNHRIPKEMECFGSAYLETDEICVLCRASEDCSKWCGRNNRNRVLDEVLKLSQEVAFKQSADRRVFEKGIEELRQAEP